MDPAATLEQYIHDLSNLPEEIRFYYSELNSKDSQFYELRKKCNSKDQFLYKNHRESSKEANIVDKISHDMQQAELLQQEKCILANTSLFLVSKYLNNLTKDIELLENEGLLTPLESAQSETPPSQSNGDIRRKRKKLIPMSNTSSNFNTSNNNSSTSLNMLSRPMKKQKMEDFDDEIPDSNIHVNLTINLKQEEDDVYCFCQQGSFGEMIACDNENCKYEWFHYDCVGLHEPPQGSWYCPDCVMKFKRKKVSV